MRSASSPACTRAGCTRPRRSRGTACRRPGRHGAEGEVRQSTVWASARSGERARSREGGGRGGERRGAHVAYSKVALQVAGLMAVGLAPRCRARLPRLGSSRGRAELWWHLLVGRALLRHHHHALRHHATWRHPTWWHHHRHHPRHPRHHRPEARRHHRLSSILRSHRVHRPDILVLHGRRPHGRRVAVVRKLRLHREAGWRVEVHLRHPHRIAHGHWHVHWR